MIETKVIKKETKHIKVGEVKGWRNIGDKGARLFEFKDTDNTMYETWSTSLADYIKTGAELDLDVEVSEAKTDTAIFIHNKVVDIKIEGQSIKAQARKQQGQRSPEEQLSIEHQARAHDITSLLVAGLCPDDLKDKLFTWLGELGKALPTAKAEQDTAKATTKPPVIVKPPANWEAIKEEHIPDFPTLEKIIWDLTKTQPAKMYQMLGVIKRADITTKPWDAFLQLKELFMPKP